MKRMVPLLVVTLVCLTLPAFAQRMTAHRAKIDGTYQFGVGGAAGGPSTTNNDDSCDIMVAPAATLLLPYFEVETAQRATDTFFTITNVSRFPQIAHVTVWTDWSFPVLDFNIFLTGYDVQPLSLYDIVVLGVIAPSSGLGGTSSATTPGSLSAANSGNPNLAAVANCTGLPGTYNGAVRTAVLSALTTGIYNAPGFGSSCGSTRVGSVGTHTTATTAVGYLTVDVTSVCSTTLPTTPQYFVSEILFDNVFLGDYQILNKTPGFNYVGGSPMVHIRAIPEGGPAGVQLVGSQTNLPYTFYARYVNGSSVFVGPTAINADRRQPLPSVFAARWTDGGTAGFNSSYRIWREGVTGPTNSVLGGVTATSCAGVANNSALPVTELVRFDEHENPSIFNPQRDVSPVTPIAITLPETSTVTTAGGVFPPSNSPAGDTDGWMYMNLNSGTVAGPANLALHPTITRASQNWVVTSLKASGIYAVDFDAGTLGNGCSGAVPVSAANSSGGVPIGPVGGVLVCPLGDPGCTPGAGAYVGTNTTP